jgi:hypothetical protein
MDMGAKSYFEMLVTSVRLHGMRSQMIAIFLVTFMKTSNLTEGQIVWHCNTQLHERLTRWHWLVLKYIRNPGTTYYLSDVTKFTKVSENCMILHQSLGFKSKPSQQKY